MKPKAIILYTDGINTDYETRTALKLAGAEAEVVHLNQLMDGSRKLGDYQILWSPGGFSYGDDIMSAKIFANIVADRFKDDILAFIKADKLVIGICNGFQMLVRMGLLPFGEVAIEQPDAALCHNKVGHHVDYWVKMKVVENRCLFLKELAGKVIGSPVAHGEGNFQTSSSNLKKMIADQQIVLQYIDSAGQITDQFPDNPNGSMSAIAGICDTTGKIFGMMPHPERNFKLTNDPNWHSLPKNHKPEGMWIIEALVNYFK